MSTFVVGDVLEHDHGVIDGKFEEFRAGLARGEWLTEAFDTGAEGLRHHIYVEEESLFPALRTGGLVAPVFVMLREHAAIWQAMELVAAQAGNDFDAAARAMSELEALLNSHNMKEEQILYPASAQVLSSEDTGAVQTLFENSQRPGGWLPTNLRA